MPSWKGDYQHIVIDCPPALGLLTVNALVAATHLLIPIQSSYFALEGTDDLLETIEKVRQRPNPGLRILGVVITMHDKRTALAGTSGEQIQKVFGGKVFKTVISKSVRLEESPAYKESIFTFAPESTGRDRLLQSLRGGHRTCRSADCLKRCGCDTTSTTWRRWPPPRDRRLAGWSPIDLLDPNPGQPRQVMGDLSELMASVAEKGVIEPLVVRQRGGRYQIIAGERRYHAAVQVGLRELPVVIREADDVEVMELALVENLQRKDLTAFEEAEALQQLAQRCRYTHEDMARKLGKSRTAITESLSLNNMPEEVRNLCRLADISSKSTLLQIVRQSDPAKMLSLVEKLATQGQTTRQQVRHETAKPKQGRPRAFVFAFRPPTKSFNLRMSFRKGKVEKSEIIEALENIIKELRAAK